MIKRWSVLLGVLLVAVPLYAGDSGALKTDRERVNYAIGAYMAKMLKQQGVDYDPDLVNKGFSDSINGKNLLISDEEYTQSVREYQRAVRKNLSGQSKHNPAADSLMIGERFLAENGTKAGVVVTKSGLQYRVLKEGNGRTPLETDTVVYNFRELLLNMKEIASSFKNGKPEIARISGELLPALREAFLLMKPGSKWVLYVPARLAYGETGKGSEIPPNSVLIYEVELLSVQ